MLELKGINLTLGKNSKLERKILTNLSLKVKNGEFIVIIGGNGAGKSTLFNVISGFNRLDSGSIYIDSRDITDLSQTKRAKLVSKVIQDPKLGTMENLTIYENMAFAYRRGQTRSFKFFASEERRALFAKKLAMVNIGLEHRLDEKVCNLSGGQRQILSIVMAMLRESKILLLDEITAALDPASSQATMELTNFIIREQKLTSIMITHNMKHALAYGDRLLLLKNGSFIKEYDKKAKEEMNPLDLAAEFGEV